MYSWICRIVSICGECGHSHLVNKHKIYLEENEIEFDLYYFDVWLDKIRIQIYGVQTVVDGAGRIDYNKILYFLWCHAY